MAEVYLLRKMRRRKEINNHRLWMLTDRSNPFMMSNSKFISKFRLSKSATLFLCDNIKPFMHEPINGYAREIQVLAILRLFATGSFQSSVAEAHYLNVSQSFVSLTLEKFLKAIMHIAKHFVSFPQTDGEINSLCGEFYLKMGFPNAVGAVDGTLVEIRRPDTEDYFVFLSRKNKFSMNIQMVCDASMKILDVVARWPGSTHDSFIWQFSSLRAKIQDISNRKKIFLLGDSGYPLEPWLLTPFMDPCCPREHTFNMMHRRTRNVIERCIGIVKGRFRILHESGGTLQYTPEKVCHITIAAAVLHNICKMFNMEMDEYFINDDNDSGDDDDDEEENERPTALAIYLRNELASHFHART